MTTPRPLLVLVVLAFVGCASVDSPAPPGGGTPVRGGTAGRGSGGAAARPPATSSGPAVGAPQGPGATAGRGPGAGAPQGSTRSGPATAADYAQAKERIQRGQGAAALADYERQASEAEARGDMTAAGRAHSLASFVALRLSNYQKAIRAGLRALELFKAQPGAEGAPLALYNQVGNAYRQAGDTRESLRYFQEGYALARSRAHRPRDAVWVGSFSSSLAGVAGAQGKPQEALGYLDDAVDTLKRVLDRLGPRTPPTMREAAREQLARSLIQLGRVHQGLGNTAAQEKALGDALTISRLLDSRDIEAGARLALGQIAAGKGEHARAIEHLSQALTLASRAANAGQLIGIHGALGRAYAGERRLDDALASYRQALKLVEDVRSQLQESDLRSGFLEDKQGLYQGAISVALAASRPEEAFGFAESGRARAFLDLLGNRTTLSKGKTRELVEQEVRLRARLEEARASARDGDEGSAEARRRELEAAEQEFRAFLDRVRRENAEQASLMTVEPVTLADIQKVLPEGTTLLEYFVADTFMAIWIVDRSSVKVVRRPARRADLVAEIRDFRKAIAELAPLPEVQTRARALYDWVIGPARADIRGNRLLLVPHDVLHYLPFAALRSAGERWLVDDYALGTLPSASVLQYLGGKGRAPAPGTLAIGNPELGAALALRYAEREARLVGQRYPGATVLVRDEATETRAKSLAPGAGLLHFALHGDLNENDPMGSALLLAPEGTDDGRLEVRELFALDLNARLVVLSACETGLGKLSRGDELVGLQRAFLYAGTEAVITTLWKVDDRASFTLMREFYTGLDAHGPARALREAQRAVTGEFPHPYAWAGFGLTGAPR